jgi:hypothetical protein
MDGHVLCYQPKNHRNLQFHNRGSQPPRTAPSRYHKNSPDFKEITTAISVENRSSTVAPVRTAPTYEASPADTPTAHHAATSAAFSAAIVAASTAASPHAAETAAYRAAY